MDVRESDIEKFWARVDTSGECWLWTGPLDNWGYGKVQLRRSHHTASRVAYVIEHGPIPSNLLVCHTCDNPRCVRPSHLFLGTNSDNQRDSIRKGRRPAHGPATSMFKPGTPGCFKLTPDQVRQIRARYQFRKVTQRQLAAEYGVSRTAIRAVLQRRSWKDIT